MERMVSRIGGKEACVRVCFGDRAAPMPPKSKADFIKVSARLTHRAAAAR